MSIASRVKELREARKMTMTEFADYVGLSQQVIWGLENKVNKNPSMRVLCKIADETGTTVDYIIGRENESFPSSDSQDPFFKYFVREYRFQDRETKYVIAQTVLALMTKHVPSHITLLHQLTDALDHPTKIRMKPSIDDLDFPEKAE